MKQYLYTESGRTANRPLLLQDAWWLIDHKTKRMVEETLGLSGVLTFTVREKQPLHLTREQVATLSVDDFLQLWQVCSCVDWRIARLQFSAHVGLLALTQCWLQGYITSLEALLKTGNDDVTSPTGQRLVLTPLRSLVQSTLRCLIPQSSCTFRFLHLWCAPCRRNWCAKPAASVHQWPSHIPTG